MAEINGKEISRSYTPTSSDEDLGHFDLLVKVRLLLKAHDAMMFLLLLTYGFT